MPVEEDSGEQADASSTEEELASSKRTSSAIMSVIERLKKKQVPAADEDQI